MLFTVSQFNVNGYIGWFTLSFHHPNQINIFEFEKQGKNTIVSLNLQCNLFCIMLYHLPWHLVQQVLLYTIDKKEGYIYLPHWPHT